MANSYLPLSGESLAASCISKVRGCKLDQSTTPTSSNSSLVDQETFYKTKAALPGSVTGTAVKYSEFYDASVLTVNVRTIPESTSTYGTNNDGIVINTFDCNSVVSGPTGENNELEKVYNSRLNNGAWCETVETIGTVCQACRIHTYSNKSSGIYKMDYQDGLNECYQQPIITGNVQVNYGGACNNYTIQRCLRR